MENDKIWELPGGFKSEDGFNYTAKINDVDFKITAKHVKPFHPLTHNPAMAVINMRELPHSHIYYIFRCGDLYDYSHDIKKIDKSEFMFVIVMGNDMEDSIKEFCQYLNTTDKIDLTKWVYYSRGQNFPTEIIDDFNDLKLKQKIKKMRKNLDT